MTGRRTFDELRREFPLRCAHRSLAISLCACTAATAAPEATLYVKGNPAASFPAMNYIGTFNSTGVVGPQVNPGSLGVSYSFLGDVGTWWITLGGVVQVSTLEAPPIVDRQRGPLTLGLHRWARGVEGSVKFPVLMLSGPNTDGCAKDAAIYVHESESLPDGTPTRLAFDFAVRCLNFGGPGNEIGQAYPSEVTWGSFRLGSVVPQVLDRAFAVADRERAVLAGAPVLVDGGRSWSPKAAIVSYQWAQRSGPAVDLADCAKARCMFAAPLVPNGGAEVVLALTVVDKDGRSDTDVVTLHVRHRRDRQSMIRMVSENDWWALSGPDQFVFTEYDGFFWGDMASGRLNLNFSGGDSWLLFRQSLYAPMYQTLAEGLHPAPAETDAFVSGRPSMAWGFQGRSLNHLDGTFFRVIRLSPDPLDSSRPHEVATHSLINYMYFRPQWVRTTLWLNHQPASAPTASLVAPTTVEAGQQFTLDGRGSTDPSGTQPIFHIYQTKGPGVTVVDATTLGLWILKAPTTAKVGERLEFAVEVDGPDGASDAMVRTVQVVESSVTPTPTPTPTPPPGAAAAGTGGEGGGATSGGWLACLAMAVALLWRMPRQVRL